MRRRTPRSTRTDTRFPVTTLFRSLHRTLPRPPRRAHPRPAGAMSGDAALRDWTIDALEKLRREAARSADTHRSEEHTSELQSLMRISYSVFCLKKKKNLSQS